MMSTKIKIPRRNRLAAIAAIAAMLLCFGCLSMIGCSSQQEEQITSIDQLNGKKVGYATGTINITHAERVSGSANNAYGFNGTTDEYIALKTGKVDAVIEDEPCSVAVIQEMGGMVILDGYLQSTEYGAIFQKGNAKTASIREQLNAFIVSLKADGTLAKMTELWFRGDESQQVVDSSGLTGENGTLTVSLSSSYGKPETYIKDVEFCGLEIDLVYRFARAYGYNVEFFDSDFSGCLAAVASGKSDFGIASITITDKRKETYDFSESYYMGGVIVAVRDTSASSASGPLESLFSSFKRTFVDEGRWMLFFRGVQATLLITFASLVLGTLLGFCAFMLCRRGGRIRRRIVDACVWFISGMPVVVLLMVMFYIVFAAFDINATLVAVVAFTLVFACSTLGMLRVGTGAVDSGQDEAARAMGYTDWTGFCRITLPQALTHITSTYESEAISLLKATAVVGYIAVQDLTKMGDIVRSATYEAFFPLIAVALVYFILEALLKVIIKAISRRINTCNRSNETILAGCTQDAVEHGSIDSADTGQIEIVLEHVGKDFGSVAPLLDVNATIRTGDIISVVGPSGCGKSTLLRAMNLLDPPTSGRILVDGVDVTAKGYNSANVNRRMGMVFQRWNLFGHWTVVENVMLPQVHVLGRSRQQAYAHSMALLESVGMTHKALSYPDELSGGQQQRVAIARTLGMDPDAILLDEPTSALDPGMVGEVQATIEKLARQGRTMLIVTHDMAFARQVCNRVFYMDEDGIYEDGSPEQVFDDPKTERARTFMLRIAKMSLTHTVGSYDQAETGRQLEDFCLKSRIQARNLVTMIIISEEACTNILPELLPEGTEIHIDYQCSAVRGTGSVTLTYTGPRIDLSASDNELAWILLQGFVDDFEYGTVETSEALEGAEGPFNTITMRFSERKK